MSTGSFPLFYYAARLFNHRLMRVPYCTFAVTCPSIKCSLLLYPAIKSCAYDFHKLQKRLPCSILEENMKHKLIIIVVYPVNAQ